MTKILFFGRESGCCQCHVFRPMVEDACKKKGYEFEFIEADDDNNEPRLAAYGVRSVPYVAVLEDGELKTKGLAADIVKTL